jgi:hypothetical protein
MIQVCTKPNVFNNKKKDNINDVINSKSIKFLRRPKGQNILSAIITENMKEIMSNILSNYDSYVCK